MRRMLGQEDYDLTIGGREIECRVKAHRECGQLQAEEIIMSPFKFSACTVLL